MGSSRAGFITNNSLLHLLQLFIVPGPRRAQVSDRLHKANAGKPLPVEAAPGVPWAWARPEFCHVGHRNYLGHSNEFIAGIRGFPIDFSSMELLAAVWIINPLSHLSITHTVILTQIIPSA